MNKLTGLITLLICLSFNAYSECDNANSHLAFESPEKEPGHFAVSFKNLTNDAFKDDEIYLYFLGFDGPALADRKLRVVTVKITGTSDNGSVAHQVDADNDAAVSPIKLSDIKNHTLYLPEKASAEFPKDGRYYGSRIYISMGKPMATLRVNDLGNGFGLPTFSDQDRDKNTIFDWLEFTYDPDNSAEGHNKVTFGGNTTGVDQFAIPLWMKVYGDQGSSDGPAGMMLRDTQFSPMCINSRQEIIDGFLSSVSSEFKSLAQGEGPARILSPVKSSTFTAKHGDYFTQYINELWDLFKAEPLKFCDSYDPKSGNTGGSCYLGEVAGDKLVFYKPSAGAKQDCTKENPCEMEKPSSKEIFTNSGIFARPGDMKRYPQGVVNYNAFGAQFAAAIARHTADNIISEGPLKGYADWHGKSLPIFKKKPNNEYADYFHQRGINHRFYGMGYDDVAAPSKSNDTTDLRPVGGPLVYINKPGERLKALVIGIQW